MKWAAAIVASLTLTAPAAAAANDIDAATMARVFATACSLPGSSGDPGVTRQLLFSSGPPPGTAHGQAALGDRSFELVAREGEFCAIRFDPLDPATLRAELEQRFGARRGGADTWSIPVDGAEGLVAYRPYVAGLSGPAWINTPSGYLYGFDAAARLDTLIFFPRPGD